MSSKPLSCFCLFLLVLFSSVDVKAQSVVEKQRIKTIRYFDNDGTNAVRDSTVFYYSGSNGSVFEPTSFLPGRSFGFNTVEPGTSVMISPVDITNNPIKTITVNARYDSVHVYEYYAGFENITTLINTYNDSLLTSIRRSYDHSTTKFSKVQYIYNDSTWPVASYITATVDGVNFTDTLKIKITAYKNSLPQNDTIYDTRSKVYQYTRYEYNSSNKLEYSYPDSGRLSRGAYKYGSNGELAEDRYEKTSDGMTWKPYFRSVYMYNSELRLVDFTNYDDEAKVYVQFQYHYNTAGDVDTQYNVMPVSNGIKPCSKIIFFFNSFHNPDSAIIYRGYCGNEALKISRVIYEYESYFDDSAGYADTGLVVLYPNPTTGLLYIKWNNKLPKEGAYINVYNASAQVLKRMLIAIPKAIDEIDLSHLSGGVYYLHIADTQKKNLYKGKIVVSPQ